MADRTPPQRYSLPVDEDYQRFAEQFVDAVLDPRQPWLDQYVRVYGFPPPIPTWDQIASGALAAKMRQAIDTDFFVDEWLYEALEKRDRQTLVGRFKKIARAHKWSRDELERLVASVDFQALRKSIKGIAEPFKVPPGPTPPTERQYDEALKRADSLHNVLRMLLEQQSTGTANTTQEILNYLAKDFPEPSRFLLDNLPRLEAALVDRHLRSKAKTRPDARARVLADAVAGSILLRRQPSTAVEYLRTERRRRRKSPR